jgi:hypothetical protein
VTGIDDLLARAALTHDEHAVLGKHPAELVTLCDDLVAEVRSLLDEREALQAVVLRYREGFKPSAGHTWMSPRGAHRDVQMTDAEVEAIKRASEQDR